MRVCARVGVGAGAVQAVIFGVRIYGLVDTFVRDKLSGETTAGPDSERCVTADAMPSLFLIYVVFSVPRLRTLARRIGV